MQASAVRPKSRELKTVVFANRTTKKSKSKIFTMYVDSAVIIIACALRRAARATVNTLIAKKTATSAAPARRQAALCPANRDADDDHDRADRRRGQH
jgi:hypothetical protein